MTESYLAAQALSRSMGKKNVLLLWKHMVVSLGIVFFFHRQCKGKWCWKQPSYSSMYYIIWQVWDLIEKFIKCLAMNSIQKQVKKCVGSTLSCLVLYETKIAMGYLKWPQNLSTWHWSSDVTIYRLPSKMLKGWIFWIQKWICLILSTVCLCEDVWSWRWPGLGVY